MKVFGSTTRLSKTSQQRLVCVMTRSGVSLEEIEIDHIDVALFVQRLRDFVQQVLTHDVIVQLSCSANISCSYTRLLPEVTLWVIALGWDRFGFPVRFSPPVTLQIITRGQLLTWQYLVGNLIHHGDRKPRNVRLAYDRSSASYMAILGRFRYTKLRVTKKAQKASATTISAISSDAVFVLQNPSPASCSQAKTCLGIPLSSELVP